jgi:hypothetical protein
VLGRRRDRGQVLEVVEGVVRIQIQIQIHTSLQEELWFEGVESVEFGSSEERGMVFG